MKSWRREAFQQIDDLAVEIGLIERPNHPSDRGSPSRVTRIEQATYVAERRKETAKLIREDLRKIREFDRATRGEHVV